MISEMTKSQLSRRRLKVQVSNQISQISDGCRNSTCLLLGPWCSWFSTLSAAWCSQSCNFTSFDPVQSEFCLGAFYCWNSSIQCPLSLNIWAYQVVPMPSCDFDHILWPRLSRVCCRASLLERLQCSSALTCYIHLHSIDLGWIMWISYLSQDAPGGSREQLWENGSQLWSMMGCVMI